MFPSTLQKTSLLILLAVSAHLAHAGSIVPADFELQQVISDGELTGSPLAARHAGDGSGRLFIVEQSGAIRIWDGNTVLTTPFLNLGSGGENVTAASGERGLLGLDFHPDFASNGRFYVNYTAANTSPFATGTTVIAEFQLSGDVNVADPASERIIMTVTQDFSNHNGGDIHFGPDGYLYIGMGDGGSGNDPCNRAQTLDPASLVTAGQLQQRRLNDSLALLGKMLRIDVDNTTPAGSNQLCAANADGSAEYAIPADNPFLGNDPDNACDEVWAYGLRNPFRFSFDRFTGDMLIGDVGQGLWEEVDFEPFDTMGGLNYGWNECEGNQPKACLVPAPFPACRPFWNTSIRMGVARSRAAIAIAVRWLHCRACTAMATFAPVKSGWRRKPVPAYGSPRSLPISASISASVWSPLARTSRAMFMRLIRPRASGALQYRCRKSSSSMVLKIRCLNL